VLDDAQRLVDEGRRLAAIELLTELNRAHPDAALESQLLQLRHDAFEELDVSPGVEVWPPDAPDLFPGAVIPEVPAGELTSETLRSGILRHGCLKVRGLVTPARVAQLRDDIDAAMDALRVWQETRTTNDAYFTPFTSRRDPGLGKARQWVTGGGGIWTVDAPRAVFDVLDTFAEVGLGETLTGYLGERPALTVKKWTLRRVPVPEPGNALHQDGAFMWHQDGAFLGQGIRVVNCWLTLSHCGDTAPGLAVVPRHLELLPTGTEGAMFDWSLSNRLVQESVGDEIVQPVFEAGDALFFDEHLLHRTAADASMTHSRYAVESWFFAPSHYPSDQVPVVI
jgi:phytanoyl-CoA dioxygenase PhyH